MIAILRDEYSCIDPLPLETRHSGIYCGQYIAGGHAVQVELFDSRGEMDYKQTRVVGLCSHSGNTMPSRGVHNYRMRFLSIALSLSIICCSSAHGQQSAIQPVQSVKEPEAPAFTADKVQPSNTDRAYPLAPGSFASIYGNHLGPDWMCSARPNVSRPETRNPAYQYLGVAGDLW